MSEHMVPPGQRRRIARICKKCKTRVFAKPAWECSEHPGETVTQKNRSYFGQPTGLRRAGDGDAAP